MLELSSVERCNRLLRLGRRHRAGDEAGAEGGAHELVEAAREGVHVVVMRGARKAPREDVAALDIALGRKLGLVDGLIWRIGCVEALRAPVEPPAWRNRACSGRTRMRRWR